MKLHVERGPSLATVTGYGPGWFEINAIRHEGALLIHPERGVEPWPVASFEALTEADFAAIGAWEPELVLFGAGPRHRFAPPRLVAALHARGIGVESMDSMAACRTYNILLAEGRRVVAALLPVNPSD